MGTQAIIFVYQGEHPEYETIGNMVKALLDSDTKIVSETLRNYNLDEKECARALVGTAVNLPSNGMTIKVEKSSPKIVITEDKKQKLAEFLVNLVNG